MMTFAALPVGARSMALFLAFQIFFTIVPIIVVFPVPAYPFSKKIFFGVVGKSLQRLTDKDCE